MCFRGSEVSAEARPVRGSVGGCSAAAGPELELEHEHDAGRGNTPGAENAAAAPESAEAGVQWPNPQSGVVGTADFQKHLAQKPCSRP